MRSLQTVSTPGQGEDVYTTTPDGEIAFRFGTREDVADDTKLLSLHENGLERYAVFADGSWRNEVLGAAVASPVAGQAWFEDDGGTARLRIFYNGSIQDIGGGGGGGDITEVIADTGLLGGGTTGAVSLEVDFSQVSAVGHDHDTDYLRLDGSNAMSDRLQAIDGTPAAPAITGTLDADTGIHFGSGFVALGVAGLSIFKVLENAIDVKGNYTLPVNAPASGQTLVAAAGGVVNWSNLSHAALLGIGADDHHAQVHALAGADHTATPWRLFYSDGAGAVTELGLGAAGEVLSSQGVSAAPAWIPSFTKPNLAAAPTLGFNFADGLDSGFGSDGVASFIYAGGDEQLHIDAAGMRVLGLYTLPADAGAAGQVIRNAGAGGTAWANLGHSDLAGITEDDHHPRTHSMDSETDHLGSPWRIFYTDDSGHVQELGLGAAGEGLISQGVDQPPAWGTVSGGGSADVGGPYTRFFLFGAA